MKISLIFALIFTFIACGDASQDKESRRQQPAPEMDEKDPGQADATLPGPEHNTPETPDQEPAPETLEPLYDPGKKGPYAVTTTTEGLTDPAYSSAIIYYPSDPSARIIGASTLSGGFTNTKEHMSWLALHLASHGFITLVFTPTNNQSLNPAVWATGHKGGLAKLISEGARIGSPIQGKVNADSLGIMGFSMGGAGTILAVNELGAKVKAAVPLCAFLPATPTAPVAILFQTGTNDAVAIPANIEKAYEAMSDASPKALANFKGLTHPDVANGGSPAQHENIAWYATAWYRVHLGGDSRYQSHLSGDEHQRKLEAGIFAAADDYRISP